MYAETVCRKSTEMMVAAAGGETVVRNLITDVAGVRVGHADDRRLASGSAAIVFDEPAVAGVDVRGGAPGGRDTELLDPAMTVERIDAITLSGGSAFGLDAASGVQAWLREQGRGFAIGPARVPIVPGAVLFDLLSGGNKNWGRFPSYREFGYAAAANAAGSVVIGGGPWFWAAPFEIGAEFGGRGLPERFLPQMLQPVIKGVPGANSTLVVVA